MRASPHVFLFLTFQNEGQPVTLFLLHREQRLVSQRWSTHWCHQLSAIVVFLQIKVIYLALQQSPITSLVKSRPVRLYDEVDEDRKHLAMNLQCSVG